MLSLLKKNPSQRIQRLLINKIGETNKDYLADFINFGVWYFVSSFLGLLANIMINSSMEMEEYGKYSYNRSILEFCGILFSLNLYTSYLRFNTQGVSIILRDLVYKVSFIALILLCLLAFYLTRSILVIPFVFIITYNERMYMARSVMDVSSVNKIKMWAIIIALIFISIPYFFTYKINSNYVLFSIGLGYMCSLCFYKCEYKENNCELLTLKTIWIYSFPGLLLVLVNWALNISGQLVIKEYFGYEDVAKFAIAQRIIAVMKLFSGLLLMFYPMVYYREIEKKNISTIKRIRLIMIGIMISVTFLAFIFSKEAYFLLGAAQYTHYIVYFRILLIAELIYTISNFYGTYLGFALKTYITLIICFVGAVFNLGILFAFIDKFGIMIASLSILIANIIMAILIYVFSYRKERMYLYS